MAVIINNVEIVPSVAPAEDSPTSEPQDPTTRDAPTRLSTIDLRQAIEQQATRAQRLFAH